VTFIKRLFAPFAALLALGGAAATAAPIRPALWAVADADTTIYLFGTIHLLPQNYQWRTAKFDQAVEGSQQLVLETIIDDKDPTKIMSAMSSLAFSPGLPPLAERVPPAKRAALAEGVKKSGFPPKALDAMETWAAAFILLGNQFHAMGLKGGEGVEAVLRNAFTSKGKPIGELETNVEQLSFFDTLPEKAQRDLLEGAISEPQDMTKDFNGMLAAWSRGDVKAIARTFNHDLAASPELSQALIKRRNQNWTKWIEQRMASPGSLLIAVGAGHLAGKDSVVAMLKKQGYRVRQVQ
jgi:uncharacterized protein YbaP (TraB family)